jgi:uncharacterized protein YuzE
MNKSELLDIVSELRAQGAVKISISENGNAFSVTFDHAHSESAEGTATNVSEQQEADDDILYAAAEGRFNELG